MSWRAVVTSLGLVLIAPATALASGGPVAPVQGGRGIGGPGSPFRFIAKPAGRDTVVMRVTSGPGEARATLRVRGQYGIPGADYNAALTGLSADGRTLILEPFVSAYPARTTHLLVLDTQRMRVQRRITLRGWSTVDAISPNGRWMYLIHYSWPNTLKYEVLAYDLVRGRLLSKPIVDPSDRGEAMTGFPLRRVMSPGGRWAYTLYFRPSGMPFVHALDTVGRKAVCVDLPSLGVSFGNGTLTLGPGAKTLQIRSDGSLSATINTRTFVVSTPPLSRVLPPPPSPPQSHPARAGGRGGGSSLPWELVFVPIVAAGALGAAVWRRAKPRTVRTA